ncbi:MAG: Two component transcriptional regulator, Fis family [Candidatus Daviesbacteria bacterium GW2011_GWF2_38_6]|uniref:Two component transcriptional regulator, Fis family n=1 Tax=Candidatus Daviesbacteria bacterium GW2011_GWF2_38_6 TaxID=1618432 RepID=A0A0G0KCH5_9BACT|nr:MAG: Two component transcriptional regulator, Fis family [Candidatus Daviesbacteria bacterium GW2011_GWF2_38_6]
MLKSPCDSTILVVDDEKNIRDALVKILNKEGYNTLSAAEGKEALGILREKDVNLILTDLKMPAMDGLELLTACKMIKPNVEVILISAYGTIEKAVSAIKDGAYDFIVKPFKRSALIEVVNRAIAAQTLNVQDKLVEEKLLEKFQEESHVIGRSEAIRKIISLAKQIAPSQATILIQGESGTGKEVIASLIHNLSPRKNKAFIKVCCAALPDTLLESELFGYEAGAFTGAVSQKQGRFELANNGTLFLDEIAEIRPLLQVKLLRILQKGEFERLGGTKTIKCNVRILAATNANLAKLVEEKQFREDLFYRLNVISFTISPLRDRKEDIPLLVNHFLEFYRKKNNKEIDGISTDAMELLMNYSWPGNVRELENAIERAVVLTKDKAILPQALPDTINKENVYEDEGKLTIPIGTTLREVERKVIMETLRRTKGDKEATAKLLGIAASTIYRKKLVPP